MGETIIGEEVVRTDRESFSNSAVVRILADLAITGEEFYPIKSPSRPLTFDDNPAITPEGDITASSLEGLWVGSYGPHGLEFGWLSVKLHEESVSPEDGSRSYERVIDFVKATGDSNVPSGQVSWSAMLPSLTLPSNASLEDPTSLGTIPSVSNETLLRWSAIDVNDPLVPESERPRWEAGSVPGAGRVALSGYVNPGWTSAVITFIRSITTVDRVREKEDGSGEEVREEKKLETVEEIRVRWQELGKVGVFKRVRV